MSTFSAVLRGILYCQLIVYKNCFKYNKYWYPVEMRYVCQTSENSKSVANFRVTASLGQTSDSIWNVKQIPNFYRLLNMLLCSNECGSL